jgi:predicted transcriptional regulator of viral defense system
MQASALKQRALEIVRSSGIARARDFERAGVPRVYLSRLRDEGLLIRTARGRYELPGGQATALHGLAEAARAVPKGVVGLVSALHFHGAIAEAPGEIWLLLPAKAWAPTSLNFPNRIVRASGAAWTTGVERHRIDGVAVPVTSLTKTFCDCFKHRAKIGMDLIVNALRGAAEQNTLDPQELLSMADLYRVRRTMAPYVEAIL